MTRRKRSNATKESSYQGPLSEFGETPVDPTQITKLSKDTAFRVDSLERVLWLRELLAEFHKHTFLKGKLVLKSGAAQRPIPA